jgi:hypothetical protein
MSPRPIYSQCLSARFALTSILSLLLSSLVVLSGCKTKSDDQPTPTNTDYQVVIRLNAKANGAPVLMDRTWFVNPNQDSVLARSFSFFISNIKLTDTISGATWSEADSYHLVNFVSDSSYVNIKLKGVPQSGKFNKISYAIGVDQAANSSSAFLGKGDLVQGTGMDWNWTDGWKFLLLEGRFKDVSTNTRGDLVYHIGFNTNYRTVTRSLTTLGDLVPTKGSRQTIITDVNLPQLFAGNPLVDVATNNNEMGNNTFTRQIADNYASKAFIQFVSLQQQTY